MTRKLLIALCCLSAVAVFSAQPAGAAMVDIGQNTGAPTPVGAGCVTTNDCTFFQAEDSGGTSYTAPSDGVITSYSISEGSNIAGVNQAQLKVFRPAGGSTWLVAGESAAHDFYICGCGALTDTLPARISVKAGDRIGVTVHLAGNTAWQTSAGAGNTVAQVTGAAPGTGTVLTPLNLIATGSVHMNLSAKFEPDADHDGFGDDSQDLCVGDPAHGDTPCSGMTIGSRFDVPYFASTACALPGCIEIAGSVPGNTTTVPQRGVIVRWRFFGIGTNSDYKLKLLRPEGPDYRIAAESSTVASGTTLGIITSPPTRIPVETGDRFGIESFGGNFAMYQRPGAGAWWIVNPTVALGGLATPVPIGGPDNQLLMGADVEADVDGDGYGDETQDGCPSDPAELAACPKPAISGFRFSPSKFAVKRKGAVVSVAKVRHGSTLKLTLSKASHVSFVVNLKATGRKVGKKCVKRTKSNRKKKRCNYYSRFWAFERDLPAGANALSFSGRMKKGRKTQTLPAGSYVVSAYPLSSLSAVGGANARATFKIVR
jgi:hypothetical protein